MRLRFHLIPVCFFVFGRVFAKVAAAKFKNVFVFDSQNVSTGSGHFVLEAARLAKQELPAAEIIAQLH